MGLHQDRDEHDFAAPVVSLSLGDSCLFRLGGDKRGDATRSFRLSSGDALVLSGEARLAFHGVDHIYPGTSTLLAEGGRINLTMRRVTRPVYLQPARSRGSSPGPVTMYSSQIHATAGACQSGDGGFRRPGLGASGARRGCGFSRPGPASGWCRRSPWR